MSRVQVPPKLASEVRTTLVDFSPLLPSGYALGTSSVTVSVYSGTDATPPTFTATRSGSIISVVETGGLLGVIYQIKVTCTATPSNTLSMTYFLAIVPDLP